LHAQIWRLAGERLMLAVETVGKPNDPLWAHGRGARELNEMANDLAKCLGIELSFAFSSMLFDAIFPHPLFLQSR